MPRLPLLVALTAVLLAAHVAPASAAKPFGQLECTPSDGVRLCSGRVPTFDGVPIDLNVTLPATGETGLPLMILGHGWGGKKMPVSPGAGKPRNVTGSSLPWAQRGYATLSISSRGFGDSCGSAPSRLAVGCDHGWIRLDDTRYEIRDLQYLAGLLVDDGIVDPRRIGAHGGSYGGGLSFALAVLRNRVMEADGSFSPWRSAKGTPLSLAAAAPYIPWTDLVYSLFPNGRTLDYLLPEPRDSRTPAGVEKQSFVSGLYAVGQQNGFIAPPRVDRDADLTTWFARINAGEPYDGDPEVTALADEIYDHHTSMGISRSVPPAPTFAASGWTDDLFPADEVLRMRNVYAAEHPDVPFSMMFLDSGHQRGTNKQPDVARYQDHVLAWMDRYVKGDASAPAVPAVETLTQTCPADAPSGGPFRAASWPRLHPGEVRLRSAEAKTFSSAAGDPQVSAAIDPVGSGGDACATTDAADESGTANWRFPKPRGDGYTLLGAPTVIADITTTGTFPVVIGRLWDVAPDGTQSLVARGVYRPDPTGRQVFQLHANGWRFAPGHVAKLQLLGRDAPYARTSNGQFSVEVKNIDVRLPVREAIGTPAPPFVPAGRRLAPGFEASGRTAKARRARPRLRLRASRRGGRRVRARVRGRAVRRVRRVRFMRKGAKPRVDRRRPYTVRLRGKGRRVRARVVLRGGRKVTLRARVRRCRT